MDATERLYYDYPELLEAEALLLAVEGEPSSPTLILDRTIFYPEGGGQPCDLGTIELVRDGQSSASAPVTAVAEEGGIVRHRLVSALEAEPGDRLRLSVDADRRIDYSQQHTAEHLLAAAAWRSLGARTVSVHFGPERSLIDFDLPSIPDEALAALEEEVDRLIAADIPLHTHLCPPEDISSFALRRPAPKGEERLRVVEIEGIDCVACCGLHRSSTGKLRLAHILGTEKYKGMTRLYFVAGGRASADYRALSRNAQEAARALGSSLAGLAEAAAKEAGRRKEAERSYLGLVRDRAASEAKAAAAALSAVSVSGASSRAFVSRCYEDRGAQELMESAKAFAAEGLPSLLASVPDLTVQALSPSSGSLLGGRLKAPLAASGGKGGGGDSSFRAVFADRQRLEAFMEGAIRELEGYKEE